MDWRSIIGFLPAAAIVALAAWILVRRIRDFVRTKGMSACRSCPYSGSCSGNCEKK